MDFARVLHFGGRGALRYNGRGRTDGSGEGQGLLFVHGGFCIFCINSESYGYGCKKYDFEVKNQNPIRFLFWYLQKNVFVLYYLCYIGL